MNVIDENLKQIQETIQSLKLARRAAINATADLYRCGLVVTARLDQAFIEINLADDQLKRAKEYWEEWKIRDAETNA